MKHALVTLARAIDWGFLEQTFGAIYTDAIADAADGGASDPQAHLRPFRRGFVRSLGGEPVLAERHCYRLADQSWEIPSEFQIRDVQTSARAFMSDAQACDLPLNFHPGRDTKYAGMVRGAA
jgi:hypothetical protein